MVQFERVLFSVEHFALILLLRRARRMGSLITYLGFEYEVSEDVLVTGSLITHRRRTLRERVALRRHAWVYPRPQGKLCHVKFHVKIISFSSAALTKFNRTVLHANPRE